MHIDMIKEWVMNLAGFDLAALITFLVGTTLYKLFFTEMLIFSKDRLYLNRLQTYRCAWISKYCMGTEPIIVIQTMRNNIMIGSFMASTAIILVMGCFNLMFGIDWGNITTSTSLLLHTHDPYLKSLKIMLLIITLLYSFFHFLWHIRELHNMCLILNVPEKELKEFVPFNPRDHLAHIYLNSAIHFALGIRGYYFLIPLLMWLFHPALMLISFFGILFFLLRRDLGKVAFLQGQSGKYMQICSEK